MSLSKLLGTVLDRATTANPAFASFSKLKASGSELRSYFRDTGASQCQILFYRDKWWTKDGGTLHGELFCLVPKVQLALCGQSQSLAEPDYSVPFHHFQFGLLESDPERGWPIRSAQDVHQFEAVVDSWLSSKAAPWFKQFETDEGAIDFMKRNGRFVDLALVCLAQGNPADARNYLISWISQLPRQIERPLAKLLNAGLITEAEHGMLCRVSQQREDQYREMVATWSADAQPSLREDRRQAALAGTPSASPPGGPSS